MAAVKDLFTKDVSDLNTEKSGVYDLYIENIVENEKNCFKVEDDITDLAEDIQMHGLLQPLVVCPIKGETAKYRLIAGHRRLKALKYLWNRDRESWSFVSCVVTYPASSEVEELMLINTNLKSREIGYSERIAAAEQVEKILIKMQKEQGVKLPGKLRKHVAEVIKTSEAAIARAKFTKDHLIKDVADYNEKHRKLNDDAAYKLAHLPEDQQREILDKKIKKESWFNSVFISQYKEAKAAGKDPFKEEKKKKEVKKCYYSKPEILCHLENVKKSSFPKYIKCPDYCCKYCQYKFVCENVCDIAKKDKPDPKRRLLGDAFKRARERAGITLEDLSKEKEYYLSNAVLTEFYNCEPSFHQLLEVSRKFNCGIDYLLGLSDDPTPPTHLNEVNL